MKHTKPKYKIGDVVIIKEDLNLNPVVQAVIFEAVLLQNTKLWSYGIKYSIGRSQGTTIEVEYSVTEKDILDKLN